MAFSDVAGSEDREIANTPQGHHWSYSLWAKLVDILLLTLIGLGIWNGFVNGILQILGIATAFLIGTTVALTPELTSLDPPRPPGGHHLVLMSHYKEPRQLFDRLVRSALGAQEHAKWKVTVVVAAEERSLMVQEGWDAASLSPDPERLQVVVAVHKKGLPGERPGLGSNLRSAIRYLMEETELPVAGTIVTKVDGNCVLPPHFLCQLEHAWATMDDTLCFQTCITELDPELEEYSQLSCFARACARLAGVIHTIPTHVFYPCGFHSSFCMPLRMICATGSWDPWMIQEDNLMLQRAVLASNGRIRCRLLRASVYNAPTLSIGDWFRQRERCITHGWFALGFVLGNLSRLKRAPLTMLVFATGATFQIALAVCLFGFPLMCFLNSPEELWDRKTNIILGACMQAGFLVLVSSQAETIWRMPEAIVCGIVAMFAQAVLYFFLSLKFLITSDTAQSYKTSATIGQAASAPSPSHEPAHDRPGEVTV